MIIGAITNSWKEHIPHTDMARMIERVRNRGASHIELRQTFLGQYEQGSGDDWRPDISRAGAAVAHFPHDVLQPGRGVSLPKPGAGP